MNTPEWINGPEDLPPNSVFVFGSNTQGIHGRGSAKTAIDKFGAVYGEGFGRQGMSYAICTTDFERKGLYPLELIEQQIDAFLLYAARTPDELFYVTKIGTHLAGYTVEDIAALWRRKVIEPNVILPKEFK